MSIKSPLPRTPRGPLLSTATVLAVLVFYEKGSNV